MCCTRLTENTGRKKSPFLVSYFVTCMCVCRLRLSKSSLKNLTTTTMTSDDRTSVQRRKVWLTPNTGVPCSNAAKTRNPLKFAGVNYRIDLSRYWAKFTILWEHVKEILLLNKFFPNVDTCLSCEDIARQSCAMVPRWLDFLRPVFAASPVQHVSDLHLKFALRPHHVWKYGRHPICGGWD